MVLKDLLAFIGKKKAAPGVSRMKTYKNSLLISDER